MPDQCLINASTVLYSATRPPRIPCRQVGQADQALAAEQRSTHAGLARRQANADKQTRASHTGKAQRRPQRAKAHTPASTHAPHSAKSTHAVKHTPSSTRRQAHARKAHAGLTRRQSTRTPHSRGPNLIRFRLHTDKPSDSQTSQPCSRTPSDTRLHIKLPPLAIKGRGAHAEWLEWREIAYTRSFPSGACVIRAEGCWASNTRPDKPNKKRHMERISRGTLVFAN